MCRYLCTYRDLVVLEKIGNSKKLVLDRRSKN
jgi:hypothetical protein